MAPAQGGPALQRVKNTYSERYSEVIAKGQQLPTLILKVIDKLRVFPILSSQCFLEKT